MHKNVKRGFTLIELLVVIAIIAILASILFPVFARARENARRASCQSNLKQIALGMFMYNQDYDEKLPRIYTSPAGTTDFTPNASTVATRDVGWAEAMQPYLKSTQIFQCPSESGAPTATTLDTGATYSDYWYNNAVDGQSDATFDYPAQTVLLGDGGAGSSAYSSNGCAASPCASPDVSGVLATIPGGGALRHLDGTNFAFADGHVKWLKGAATSGANMNKSSAVMNSLTKNADAGGRATFSAS